MAKHSEQRYAASATIHSAALEQTLTGTWRLLYQEPKQSTASAGETSFGVKPAEVQRIRKGEVLFVAVMRE